MELDNHWAAEDEVLTLQSEIDELTVQLKESESAKTSLKAKLTTSDAERSQGLETIDKVKSDHQVCQAQAFFFFLHMARNSRFDHVMRRPGYSKKSLCFQEGKALKGHSLQHWQNL